MCILNIDQLSRIEVLHFKTHPVEILLVPNRSDEEILTSRALKVGGLLRLGILKDYEIDTIKLQLTS